MKIAVIGGSGHWSGLLAAYKAAGAEIVFLEPDNAEELKGAKLTGVIIDELTTGELGTFEEMRIVHDMRRAAIDNAALPDKHRIQHGPVRKGRGGKVKRW